MFVCGCAYVCMCFQKCHNLQGTSVCYPASQHNTVSTSPFNFHSPHLLKQSKILVCIYRFVWCVYVFNINNTLWNRNTQHPAIFLAFGPFFSLSPYSPFLLQILHNPLCHYVMLTIPLGFISRALYGLENHYSTF